jgi:beta-glucosidase
MTDVPVLDVTPVDGVVRYDEGIHIGYRAWLRAGVTPAYPFGFGLGYTEWELGEATVTGFDDNDTAVLSVPVRNVGDRAGKQVVQVYASRPDSTVDRPSRWLVGFAVVRAEAGAEAVAEVAVRRRALSYWADGWQDEPGAFTLRAAFSVEDAGVTSQIAL